MDIGHAHRPGDGRRIGNAIDAVERAQLDAGNDRGATCLIEDEVRLRVGDDLVARTGLGGDACQVAHGPARNEDAGLLAEAQRHLLLEPVDRRILAPHIVTNLGAGHRRAHPLVGNGQRVTPKVDEAWHGCCSRGWSPVHPADTIGGTAPRCHASPVASHAFRLVQGAVRKPEELRRGVRVLRIRGDADADGEAHRAMPRKLDLGRRDRGTDLLGDDECLRLRTCSASAPRTPHRHSARPGPHGERC